MFKLNIQLFSDPVENYDNKDDKGNVKILTPSGVTYYFPKSLFDDIREGSKAGDELLPALIYTAYNFEYGESVFETLNRQHTALGIPNNVRAYIQSEVDRRGGTMPSSTLSTDALQRWFVKEYMLPEFAKTLGYDEYSAVYQRIKKLGYGDNHMLGDLTHKNKGYQKNIASALSGSNVRKDDPKSGETLTFTQHKQKYLDGKYLPGLGFPVFKGTDGTLYYELQGALVDKNGKAVPNITGVMLVNGKEQKDAKEITINNNTLPFLNVTGNILPSFDGHDINWSPTYSGSESLQSLLTRSAGGKENLKDGLIYIRDNKTYVYNKSKDKWGLVKSFGKIETPIYAEGDLSKAISQAFAKQTQRIPVPFTKFTHEGVQYEWDKNKGWKKIGKVSDPDNPDDSTVNLDGTYDTFGDAVNDTVKDVVDPISFAYGDHFDSKNKYYEDIFSLDEGTLGARMLQNNEDLFTKEANNALLASQTAMQTQGLAQAQALKQITDSIRAERMAQLRSGMSEAQLAEREIQMLMAGNKQMTDNLYQANQGMFEAQLAGETAKEQAFNQYIEQASALGQVTAGHHAAAAGDLIEQAKQLQSEHYIQNGEQLSLGAALDKVVAAKKGSPMDDAF